jgi:hypothetical protein
MLRLEKAAGVRVARVLFRSIHMSRMPKMSRGSVSRFTCYMNKTLM